MTLDCVFVCVTLDCVFVCVTLDCVFVCSSVMFASSHSCSVNNEGIYYSYVMLIFLIDTRYVVKRDFMLRDSIKTTKWRHWKGSCSILLAR